ncbi:unnamed protein product [Lactuca virosa]|uniref:Hexosyltransferase n=1 Tax=Lactuca virosa TaxID=75947 RepID=A0AAU9N8N8_9ASTR|nr:unnamed protein product [Lactuca virosa]
MQLHFSPSMRSITISSSNGFIKLMKIKVAARHISYRTLFHTILILAFLLPFVFILTAIVTLEGVNKCSSIDCLGRRLGPKLLRRGDDSGRLVNELYNLLNQVNSVEVQDDVKLPDNFTHLITEMKSNKYDAKEFAVILKRMMERSEKEIKESKFSEIMNKHIAASSIPKSLHCLSLRLTDEYSSNAHARRQLPSPDLLPLLSSTSHHHFILSTDNILAASVVVNSAIHSSSSPEKIVFHVITDKKTDNVPVLEAVESHDGVRDYYYNGNHVSMEEFRGNLGISPRVFASKLQARSPKYILLLNHLRIYLPELFPNLEKVVFLDDDIVIQRDLSPLWDVDLGGKVNGAVETCKDPQECAWAYGMNIFDLKTWRTTNIKQTYHTWLKQNLKSNLTLWRLGTLPPALLAFRGHVHGIDQSWHMLGLGYQNKTNIKNVKKAAVIHYNGQSKPWLEIGFGHLRPFWSKYVNYSNDFVKGCHILE